MGKKKSHRRRESAGACLYRDETEKRELEARNGLLQFDEVTKLIGKSTGTLNLTVHIVKRLHFCAIQDIYSCAGNFRKWDLEIKNSSHRPPQHRYVEGLVEEMCERANSSTSWSPVKTAAYLLWRLNWIHPFAGGNGRTSRAICHLGLCVRLGFTPPGKLTIPEQIRNNGKPYQGALEDADDAWKSDVLDVSKMELLLDELLKKQIASVSGTKKSGKDLTSAEADS